MAFPLSLQGRIFSQLPDVESTLAGVEASLRESKARSLKRDGGMIHFRGSFLSRRFGGSVLTVISWGTIQVSRTDTLISVEYDLHFLQNHLVRGAVSAAAFGAIYFGVKEAESYKTVAFGLVFWVLIASLDYLLAASFFPRYLESKLSSR